MTSEPYCLRLPRNLHFRGEGNCNLVLSEPDNHRIYRLRKASAADHDAQSSTVSIRTMLIMVKAVRRCVGDELVQEWISLPVDRQQLQETSQAIQSQRPDFRLSKHIDLACDLALCSDDACALPAAWRPIARGTRLAVELKPKFGAVLRDWALPGYNRFCVKSHVDYSRPWAYCPLDLLSADSQRVRAALHAMVREPRQYLRVFVDGEMQPEHKFARVFAQFMETECLEEATKLFIDQLLTEVLLYQLQGDPVPLRDVSPDAFDYSCALHPVAEKRRTDTDIKGIQPGENSVLGRLLRAQLQNSMSLEQMEPHYAIVCDFLERKEWDWAQLLKLYLDDPEQLWRSTSQAGEEQSLHLVIKHQICLTLRDCSIIVALQQAGQCPPDGVPEICVGSKRFLFKATLVDLDSKFEGSLHRHLKTQDRLIDKFRKLSQPS